jgi:hypothetical protein
MKIQVYGKIGKQIIKIMEKEKIVFIIFGIIWIIGLYVAALLPYYKIVKNYGKKGGYKLKSLLIKHFFFSIYHRIKYEMLLNVLNNEEINNIKSILNKKIKYISIYFLISVTIFYIIFHVLI